MKGDDFLLAMTASLLARGETDFLDALARWGRAYALERPREPKMRSLGARLVDGRELGLAAWLREARAGAARSVRVAEGKAVEIPGLPAFQAAGFAGTGRSLLAVADGPRRGVYAFVTEFCPSTAMTPAAFVRWIDRQDPRAMLWTKLSAEIDNFQKMNGRTGATPETVRALAGSAEGQVFLDNLGMNILPLIQSSLKRVGAEPEFAEGERELFETSDPDEFQRGLMGDGGGPFIPSEEQLQIRDEFSAAEFVGLVDAQEARVALWKALGETLASLLGRPVEEIGEPAAALRALPAEESRMYVNSLLSAAQRAALVAGKPLRVPDALRARVATEYDFLDAEQRAGYVPARERLQFASNRVPWEFYALVEIPGVPLPPAEPLAAARAAWRESLGVAERLARRLESPYAEAFRLAAYALDHAGADDAALGKAGFAENARRVWADESALIDELGLPQEQHRALLSVSIGDVFGGMGSWNDQAPGGEDEEEFARVSTDLLARLRTMYAAALTLVP
jgi:hypothetical protein